MFEGWASDLLASYLGQFLEVQREQLRISLWSAWRTGFTLDNVALRPGAFDHMQLPFKLASGRIGTLQIHVPWRALRSPVAIELADVELTLILLGPDDLTPEAASERSWAAKQAAIAAAELAELAAGVSDDGKPAEARQGGVLWSLAQHAVTMLLRRLQLTVRNVHVRVEDPATGRAFGLRLASLHTCAPGETEHASLLLAEDAGVAVHSSAAARGSIQKQLAAEGLEFYWKVGPAAAVQKEGEEEDEAAWRVLQPASIVVHLSSKIIGAGGSDPARLHAAAVVHALPLSLRPCQVDDMLRCADTMQWTAARAKHAALRPATQRNWRAMWRYAVNAVLAEAKGPLCAAEWQSQQMRQHANMQYVLLYRKKLELEREAEGREAGSGAEGRPPAVEAGQQDTPPPSPQPPRSPVRHVGHLSPVGEQRLVQLERQLCVADIVACRAAARHSLGGAPLVLPTCVAPETAGSEAGSRPGSAASAVGASSRRGVFWALTKAASAVGYRSGGASLPQPSESDVRELYEAVDFHPDAEDFAAAAAVAAAATGQPLLEISLNFMLASTVINLHNDDGGALARLELQGLRTEVRAGREGLTADVTLSVLRGVAFIAAPAVPGLETASTAPKTIEVPLLGRGPRQEEASPRVAAAPLLRLHLTAATSTLDVLVQPLRLRASPALLQSLVAFVPPAIDGSFGGSCMAAVNALGPTSRAAIKADKLAKLGPPLDLVAKIMDVEVLLTAAEGGSGGGVALRTGSVVLHSVGQAAAFAAADPTFKVLSRLREVMGDGSTAAGELSAAAAAVEQRLVYQHLDFTVSGLTVGTVDASEASVQFLAAEEVKEGSTEPTAAPAELLLSSCLLQPAKISGGLDLHRIVEDFGVPQVKVTLALDTLRGTLTARCAAAMAAVLSPPPATPAAAVAEPAPAPVQNLPLGPVITTVKLSLATVDFDYTCDEYTGTRLSLGPSSVSLDAHTRGLGLALDLHRLELTDVSHEEIDVHPAVLTPVPRLGRRVAAQRVEVSLRPGAMVGVDSSTTEVILEDLEIQGYEEEAGNFAGRTAPGEPAQISVTVSASPAAVHVGVSMSNVSLGHATLLRAAAFGMTAAAPSAAPAASTPTPTPAVPAPGPAFSLSLDVRECRVVCCYQRPHRDAPFAVPGNLQDFFSIHDEIFSLELPRMGLNLPFVGSTDGEGAAGSNGPALEVLGASLVLATTGFPGHPSLPVVKLPQLVLAREAGASGGGGGAPQQLRLMAPVLDFGLHPSHLILATLAAQLCQHQLIDLLGGSHSDRSTDAGSARPVVLSPASSRGHLNPVDSMAALNSLDAEASASSIVSAASPAPPVVAPPTDAPTPWHLEASVGVVGLSLLGSTPSSTCMKLEWVGMTADVIAGAVDAEALAAQLNWTRLSLHVLRPRDAGEPLGFTPFSASGGLFGSPVPNISTALPLTPPFLQPPGPAPAGTRGVRRSLSLGVGLAGATDQPHSLHENAPAVALSPEPSLALDDAHSALRPGTSGVSRYMSAQDSEFEDAASDFMDAVSSVRSPPEGRSPRAHAPLPLDPGNTSEYDVEALFHLGCSMYAAHSDGKEEGEGMEGLGGGGATAAALAVARRGQSTAVTVSSVALRVYLHGWSHAVECVHNYERFWAQAAGRAHAVGIGHARLVAVMAGPAPPAPPAPSASPEPRETLFFDLTLRARDLEVEAVAAAGAPPPSAVAATRVVPAGRLVAQLAAEVQVGPEGARLMLAVPGAVVCVGAVPAGEATGDAPLPLSLEDALIGLSGLEITASSETFEFEALGEDRAVGALGAASPAPAAASVRTRRSLDALAVSLDRASVWAGQRTLCVAAALGQHVGHMAAELTALQGSMGGGHGVTTTAATARFSPFDDPLHPPTAFHHHHQPHIPADGVGEVLPIGHPAAEGGGVAPAAPARPSPVDERHAAINIEVGCVAVLLQSERPKHSEDGKEGWGAHRAAPSPLAEARLTAVALQCTGRGDGDSNGSASFQLALDVFNGSKMAWEPVVEPWGVELNFAVPQLAAAAAVAVAAAPSAPGRAFIPSRHLKLEMVSKQGLETTVTATATDAGAAAAGVASAVAAAAAEPDTFHRHLTPEGGASAAFAAAALPATFQLHNLTGSRVEVWLEAPAAGVALRTPAGPPTLTLAESGRCLLPVMTGHDRVGRSRWAGRPSLRQGVVDGGDSDATVPAAPTPARPLRRTLMYFRLEGQCEACGPVLLDSPGALVYPVELARPGEPLTAARVVAETAERRHGSHVATLHSGVRVTNTTPVDLEVGLTSSLGVATDSTAASSITGYLRPGHSAWLPASTAEAAVLRVKPCESYRPDRAFGGGLHPLPFSFGASTLSGGGGGGGGLASIAGSGVWYRSRPSSVLPSPQASGTATPTSAHAMRGFEWSAGVSVAALLRAAGGEGGSAHGAGARQLSCPDVADATPPLLLQVSTALNGAAWEVTLAPPLTLHSALPVPVEVSLSPRWGTPLRLHLAPNERLPLLHVDASAVDSLALCPEGFQPTRSLSLTAAAAAAAAAAAEQDLSGAWQMPGNAGSVVSASHDESPPGGAGGTALEDGAIPVAPAITATLHELPPGRAAVDVAVQHAVFPGSGAHLLRLYCGVWVYNCVGVPLALRPPPAGLDRLEEAAAAALAPEEALLMVSVEDDVPDSWVPPLQLPTAGGFEADSAVSGGLGLSASPGGRSELRTPRLSLSQDSGRHQHSHPLRSSGGREGLASARTAPPTSALTARSMPSVAGSMLSLGRTGSVPDVPGLSEILENGVSGGGRRVTPTAPPLTPGRSSVLGLQRSQARARGIADSMDRSPTFERPSTWPAMGSGALAGGSGGPPGGRLRLQLRAAPTKAPVGRTFWSQPVDLDASGGAAIAVIPSPAPAPATAAAAAAPPGAALRGSYPVVVTAAQVPGAHGVLAVAVAPRFILRNALDVPIQYRQDGANTSDRSVPPGGARAVRWTDDSLPPRLCVRVQEAGWLWSGGFGLDAPGDVFVKIRHRDREVTMLVRVDVAMGPSHACHITLSHNPTGFAPYRVENCSTEILHARQRSVREQQDVLRPYNALNYAWDEPTQPHKLVIELPGGHHLGTFDLDKVGADTAVTLPKRRGELDPKHFRVFVRAEGPTRVLTVVDTAVHVVRAPGNGGSGPGVGGAEAVTAPRDVALSGPLWEFVMDLGSVGVSLVGPTHEVAYLRLSGVRVSAAAGAARNTLGLAVARVQLDNPSPWVAFPVTLVLPAPASKLTSSVAAAVELAPRPALEAALSLWQRRPAGVLCVELAQLKVGSVAVYLDQQHLEEVMAVVGGILASPGLGAAAAAAAGALQLSAADPGPDAVLGGARDGGSRAGSRGSSADDLAAAASWEAGAASTPRSYRVESAGEYRGPSRAASPSPLAAAAAAAALPALGLPAGELGTPGGLAPALIDADEPSWHRQKIYIDTLSISPVEATLSFLSSPVHHLVIVHPRLAALQRLLSLADVEDARVWLAGLQLSNPLMDAEALGQALSRHYMYSLIPELLKLLGAASVIGDPVSLLQHLGAGVWAFVAAPAEGLVASARDRGPRAFLVGVGRGTRGLLQNVVFAVSNAATKAAGAARKAIVVWGLDRRWEEPLGSGTFRRRVMFVEEGLGRGVDGALDDEDDLVSAILRGLTGLLSEPIRGVEEGGLPGLLRGMQRGALGAVALPLAVLLEMAARFADSVRRAVAGSSNLGWLRPPRHVGASEALAPYDWSESMGRWLLAELRRGEARAAARRRGTAAAAGAPRGPEDFWLCRPARVVGSTSTGPSATAIAAAGNGSSGSGGAGSSGGDAYVVVTSHRVLCLRAKGLMWEPQVQWAASGEDLELVCDVDSAEEGTAVRFSALPPPLGRWRPQARQLPRKAPRRALFSVLSVEFDDGEAADAVKDVALRLQAGAAPAVWHRGATGLGGDVSILAGLDAAL